MYSPLAWGPQVEGPEGLEGAVFSSLCMLGDGFEGLTLRTLASFGGGTSS